MIVKNRVDYYLLHTYVCANMGMRSAYQHEISLSQKTLNGCRSPAGNPNLFRRRFHTNFI